MRTNYYYCMYLKVLLTHFQSKIFIFNKPFQQKTNKKDTKNNQIQNLKKTIANQYFVTLE